MLVFGEGIYNKDNTCSIKGKHTKEYQLWCGVLERCYSASLHKERPTYTNCSMSDNFKQFAFFNDWCSQQIGFSKDGFTLDKDLLLKGNKLYSEETCVFIPRKINTALTNRKAGRGEFPLGVYKFSETRFRALCCVNGTQKHLGLFHTVNSAFAAYKSAKEAILREYAKEYRQQIDPRAYEALCNYQIEIDD